MAYRGVKDDFLACSQGRVPSRMPAVSFTFEFYIRQAGLTDADARQDIAKVVKCLVEAVKRYDEDWAIVFPDDYIEFEPLGLKMHDDPHLPTMPVEYLPMTAETLARFRIPDAKKAMRLPVQLEMIRRVKQALGDAVLVMGRIAAPFSAMALIYNVDAVMMGMLSEPDLLRDNMKFLVDHQIAFGQAQLDAGADLLWLGDCCAASNFIRAEHFAEFAFEPAAQVAEALKKRGGLLIYHNAETSLDHLKHQVQLPVHAINIGEGHGADIAQIKQRLDPKLCLMGNYDAKFLRDESPERNEEATETMIRKNLPGGRYIFNTGEGVMRHTPVANYEAMNRALRRLAPLAKTLAK